MLLRREPEGQASDAMHQDLIPAIYENGMLKFVNNGVSEVFFGPFPAEFESYHTEGFQFFAMCNAPVEHPFFVSYDGKIPLVKEITDEEIASDCQGNIQTWELFHVRRKRKLEPDGTVKKKAVQYSCLRRCKPGTLFCKCDDCGDNFVITMCSIKFYEDRRLQLPTVRCQKCIQKKRIRYAARR